MRRAFSFLPLLSCMTVATMTLGAQQPSSYSYDFRTTGDHHSDGVTGTVRVNGARARIDVEDRGGDGQYLLVSGDGQVVTVVKPRERTYTIFTADDFAHIASLGLRAAGSVLTMKLRDANIESQKLGAGDAIAGHATQHVKMFESWTMEVGAMGFTTPVRQTVETEYFFDPALKLARNPLTEVLESAIAVLPSTDREFSAKADSVRRSLLRGTPLRTVITEREDNGRSSRTVIEVTHYGAARVDEAELKVPAGYTRKDGDIGRFKVKL
jgi:hypothetical protein